MFSTKQQGKTKRNGKKFTDIFFILFEISTIFLLYHFKFIYVKSF